MEDYKKVSKQTQRKMKEFIKRWNSIKLLSNNLFTESEDKRISKEIINYFKCQSIEEPSRKDTHNKWIHWLEKQSQKETTWNKQDEENMNNVLYILNQLKDTSSYNEDDIAEKTTIWLKSLKDRLCSNDEYDKDMLGAIEYCIKNNRPLEKEHIAWLVKESEHVEINPSEFDLRLNRLLKQFETLPKEELASSLSFYLNVVQNDGTYKDEEKQGEQKPSDKVEPKFKVGDKIIRSSKSSCPVHDSTDDTICKVAEIHDTCYILDTKEGKVQEPFIWQDYYKLVVQKPAEWSEDDEVKINRIVACLENLNVADNDILLKDVDWLKSLKTKVQPKQDWSEEDEKMLADACIMLDWYQGNNWWKAQHIKNWLKALKQRIGG